MPCFAPLIAYYGAELTKNGKRGLVFDSRASFSGLPVKIACGQCVGCRLERSRQWAVRCVHENKMHDVSWFVTLTYDDDHLPQGGTLVKRDLQLFMKRLRKARNEKIRFYACGEYGDRTQRPHYHLLLFGVDFPDRRLRKRSASGYDYYDSAELRKLWPAGQNIVGAVTFESAAYVARYVMKKITGDVAEWHYSGREPEFQLMSRRPGIGYPWLVKYGSETYRDDSCIIRGKEVKPPRYYDCKWREHDERRMDYVARLRRTASIGSLREQVLERRVVREAVCRARLGLSKREI